MKLSTDNLHKRFIYIILLILPLLYVQSVFNPYEFPKFAFFTLGIYIVGLFTAISILLKKKKNVSLQLDKVGLLIIGFVLVQFIADLFGVNFYQSFVGSYWRHQGFILLMSCLLLYILLRINIGKKEVNYTPFIVFSNILTCLYALSQKIRIDFLADMTIPTYQGRIVGTMGNPNFLAGFIVMTLPFVIASNFFKNKYLDISAKIAIVVLDLYILDATGSRGGWIALAGIFIVFSLFYFKLFKYKLIIWLTIVTVLVWGFVVYRDSKYTYNKTVYNSLNRGSDWDNREFIWIEGVKSIIFKRPLLGFGQENFSMISQVNSERYIDNAHNIFLEVLSSSGVVGLSIFILIVINAVRKLPLVPKLALIGFLIRAQFNPLSIAEIAYLWLLIGLVPELKGKKQ